MDRKEKRKVWDKTYREKHAEELHAKRVAKWRAKRDAVLNQLVIDYINGATLEELQKKYKVIARKD